MPTRTSFELTTGSRLILLLGHQAGGRGHRRSRNRWSAPALVMASPAVLALELVVVRRAAPEQPADQPSE